MNIELKNIKYYEPFSEEHWLSTPTFTSKANALELPKMMAAEVPPLCWILGKNGLT